VRTSLLVMMFLSLASCSCPTKKVDTLEPTIPDKAIDPRTRAAAVPKDHPLYDRVEGTAFANACQTDKDCFTGGCGAEICSANVDATSSCDVQEWPTKGASCGCVAGECAWYRGVDPDAKPVQGQPCPDQKCADGLTCIEYYGIAGPQGPKFTSCEVPCGQGGPCPEGQTCITIADGPGQVCRGEGGNAPPAPTTPAPAPQPSAPTR
jgi:eight-cysteine-cluster-containing protein